MAVWFGRCVIMHRITPVDWIFTCSLPTSLSLSLSLPLSPSFDSDSRLPGAYSHLPYGNPVLAGGLPVRIALSV